MRNNWVSISVKYGAFFEQLFIMCFDRVIWNLMYCCYQRHFPSTYFSETISLYFIWKTLLLLIQFILIVSQEKLKEIRIEDVKRGWLCDILANMSLKKTYFCIKTLNLCKRILPNSNFGFERGKMRDLTEKIADWMLIYILF